MNNNIINRDFMEYMIEVEGSVLGVDWLGEPVFKSYKSAEGGTKTIGIGHKLAKGEKGRDLSRYEALCLFGADLAEAYAGAARIFDREGHNITTWDLNRQRIAVEFTFNMGVSGFITFPKFRAALAANDYEGMTRECKRSYRKKGRWVSLVKRNKKFKEEFLTPHMP